MNELTPNAQLRIQYWLDIIHQCRESGQSNSQWCAENGISIKSYYYWLAKIRKMAVEELPRKKHAFCQTERILCRCNCKRHRRCADNHPGTSGRLYQSAFRNRKKSGSTVTHRQKRAASDTGKACAGCLLVVGRNGICRNPSKIKTGRSIHLCIQSERRSNELPAGWELFHLQQPCRKQYPSVHHWPEELAVFREPQGRRSECRNLYID